MSKSRKRFEEDLIADMHEELGPEPMCNILMYAASYLRGEVNLAVRISDLGKADVLDKYAPVS